MSPAVDIKVYITRHSRVFRARIKEPDNTPYEVTIGGEQWIRGLGKGYKKEILRKIDCLMERMIKEHKLLCVRNIQRH